MKACSVLVLLLAGLLVARRTTTRLPCRNWFLARRRGRRKISIQMFSTHCPRWTSPPSNNFSTKSSGAIKATTWWIWPRCGKPHKLSCRCWKAVRKPSPMPRGSKRRWIIWMSRTNSGFANPPPKVETNCRPPVPNPPPQKDTRDLGEKSCRSALVGPGKRICAGVEADFRGAKDSAGIGLVGGSGIVI